MKVQMKRWISLILAMVMVLSQVPFHVFATEQSAGEENPFAGKKVSILSHSMSTYAGVSNNTSANSTIGKNDVYYTEGRHGVYLKDTWWMQTIDALDMELLVNNSWSGSCVFQPRKGEASVGYGDRAVNLHNDHTGEEPDVIFVYLGCNDFAYFKDTFGKAADVDYAALIQDNGNGTYTYAVPTTACEAYAIMLHKVENRYPNAEIYCMTSTARREIDYAEDNRPDAGQPTTYVAELQKIANYFGFPVVDLENAIPKDVEIFDKYIGDKRAHANALGMDQITNEVLSVMLGREAEICHVTADHEAVAEQAVLLGGSYNAEVNIPQGYSVVVTMSGRDVTASAYKDGRIAITEVTGDIHVETVINRDPQNFRWEFRNDTLTSVGSSDNVLTKLSGTVANNILNDGIFQLNTPVVLKHDLPWAVEWKCSEDWRGAVLVTHKESATKGMTFLTRTKGGQLCFGTYTGSQYDNYGVDISGLSTDTHTYRLENRMAADGSNMVWLYVDGEEVGPMNNYFIGSKDQSKTSDWVSGKDFVFSFIGMTGHALRNCQLDYLSIQEGGHTHSYKNGICTGCGDVATLAGKTLSILGASISTYTGISNNTSSNATIGKNAVYYTEGRHGVYANDTWWMQAANDLGLRLLVNNSWSGSALLHERNGTVGAYVNRCVQLHNNQDEEPDIIAIQMGSNDFQYYKDTLGTAEIDYAALIKENADGTFTYATPVTSLEAAAIVLHKISVRYPNAEVYYLNVSQRVDNTDELIRFFNGELKQVVEHFGASIVDIYGSAITMEDFDTYIGDGKAHPNKMGMDAYTEAFKRALVANTNYAVTTHTVSMQLDDVTADYGDDRIVVSGDSYTLNLTASDALDVTVIMGGQDITQTAYHDGKVTIDAVTADVVITAKSVHQNQDYRWEFNGTDLAGENTLTKISGTTTDGVFSNTCYALEKAVVLYHDQPWIVEWKCEGTFLNSASSTGARVFSSTAVNAEYNARSIFKSNINGLVTMGEKTTTGSHNYGIALGNYGIDWTALHTYRLENRIAENGSNMVYLFVDGREIGPMNHYYVGTTDQNTTSDWLSGKDFVFPYMGTDTHGFTNAAIEFIAVWEAGHTHTYENGICTGCGEADPNEVAEPLALRYDDHYDVTGKTVEIVDGGESVLAVEGNYLVATGIGRGKVRIDGTLYEITVEKAKINIVVIMGQSNAGNHFANATSDVTCPLGTAYWWKNGATEPVDYTQPSMGFHTPLIAELYAQSVAAGDPVKNVMVWQEGVTSQNGQSIVKWAATETDTSGTDGTATMIKNCIAYYEKNSDLYEIVNCGVYWLQGESDVSMSPEKYTGLFMAMWNKLKEAGAEYVAFFRVRKGTTGNDNSHHDLSYTGSLVAQLNMVNSNPDMFLATTITENWVGDATTEHSVDISNYMTLVEEYGKDSDHNDDYGNAATIRNGILTTTMKTLYGSNNRCHYGKFGYGIIGADAAYNMHQALHSDEFAFVMADTSGEVAGRRVLNSGESITVDITDMTENLAFRAACGSTAGTLAIKVSEEDRDITANVIAKGVNTFGTVDVAALREYDDVRITVSYATLSGATGNIDVRVIDNTPDTEETYLWDFNNDLNARDENGEVINGFESTALKGSYTLENGLLKGTDLQLELQDTIRLSGKKNWSIEWKFGEVSENSRGFLLCNTEKSEIGTKTIYLSPDGKISVSDYADSKGYRNYYTDDTTYTSNDIIKITNRFDPETQKSTLSLWKNGKEIVSDLSAKGNLNKTSGGLTDMSGYNLSGDFVINYLGCKGIAYFSVTNEIDYIKIVTNEVAEPLALRYDDHYDVTGKTVEIIDAGKPTSYQVGYGVEENKVLDTAVVTLKDNALVATGIGTAKVKIDGVLYEVTVTAAPISLLLLIGQSNMRGSEGNANQSIVCPDGMVYSTYGDDRGESNTAMTVSNATRFAPSALTGTYSSINVVGTTDCLSGYPVYSLTEAGAGKIGPDSGFAYEWVKQTGEKVWVVNAAHGGTSINVWQPGTTEYEQCQALFTACQETLRKEIAAGHFTLSHMAYFWCQGCSDRTQSAQWYVNKYLAMHSGLKTEMSFDHDSNADTADKTFEFGGIIPVRVGSTATCYRDGVYSISNPYAYHESFVDLRFSGPRVAQYWMINNPELSDIWGVCDIGDNWVWMPDGTNGVTEYFQSHYENGTVDYTTQVKQSASWYTPTTPKAVHDSIHYNQIGYNEYGREAVRNALIMLGEIESPDVETTVELLSWDGYTPVEQVTASTAGNSGTLVVPKVYPIWKSKDIAYELSEGLTWDYYDLLAADVQTEGTLTAGGQTVCVAKAEPGVHYVEHLSELPEDICCGLNLWPLLEHDSEFYYGGTHWAIHGTKDVMSVTIPVIPGDKVFATSFGKAGQNGHETSNGIRVTFFSEYGVAKTMAPAECYAEFTANGGYLVAPENAIAINVAMWNNSDENELYLLDRAHDTDSGICGICGKDSHIHSWSGWQMKEIPGKGEPVTEERVCSGCGETETREVESVWQKYDLAAHYSDLPENLCSGLNLWNMLEHDKYYFASGTNWSIYSGGTVKSVTISVEPGDKIFATAFGKAGQNGHTTSSGIRVTFFSAYGVAKTMTPAECYAEFSANGGYLVAPENAIAINVAMWNNSDDNELYILNREHTYENGICTGCGEKQSLQLVDGFDEVSSIQGGDSRLLDAHDTVSPLILENLSLFENCRITAVNLFVTGTVVDNDGTNANDPTIKDDEMYTFDLVVLDASSVKAGQHYTIKRTYTLTVLGSDVKKNAWNTFDVTHLGITVGKGETLGFGSSNSTLEIFYLSKCVTTKLRYYGHNTTTGDTTLRLRTGTNLPVGVEGYKIDCTHQYVASVTAPTCTEQGYTTYTCSTCGDVYVDFYVDATGHNWSNGICTFCGEGKKPYKRLTYFTVQVEADGKTYSDNAVLYLPANYTSDGEPVRLVIYCKQGTSQITSSSNPIESVGFYNYLLSLGYAVLGVDGVPDAWRDELGICERAVGNPVAVQGTEKAYDYVIENYNIAADGCFISGYSQGGHYAQNVIDLTDIPILAAAEQSPVCSMQYHQWDLNASVTVNNVKYSKAARLNVARIYGFPAFATNAELLNLAYDNTLVEEYDPWVRNSENIYTGFVQKSNLWYLPEGTSVDDITMTHTAKCPVKIWCAEDDTAISADVMKVFVKAIQNAGGTAEISIAPSGGHGFFQKQTAVGSFTENGKTYNTLPIAVEIADWFAQYGGYEHIHTYENGICTVCGAKEPVSHIPGDITGDGELNNKDVTRLFKYLSGYDVEVDEAALDINGDGEIDNKDLTRLFRYLSGHDVTIY